MNLRIFRTRQNKVIGATLVIAGILAGIGIRNHLNHPVSTAESIARATATLRATGSSVERETTANETPSYSQNAGGKLVAPLSSAQVRAIPAAIAAIFPDLIEMPLDWRQFRPDSLTVAAHPDLPITFTKIRVKEEGKYVTWIGRNPQIPGASLVGVATAAGYNAILTIPGAGEFNFYVHGNSVEVREIGSGEESCGVGPVQWPKPSLASGPSLVQVDYVPGFNPDAGTLAVTAAYYVDVLFAYNPAALTAASASSNNNGISFLDSWCKAVVESANLDLSQSGVTAFAWRYIGLVAAPNYTRTGILQDDLHTMAPGGAIYDWVKTIRYQRGADQVMLLVESASDFVGYAYSPKQIAVTRDLGCAVMTWNGSSQTVAHELAHNFGCNHDRAHTDVKALGDYGPPAPDNDGFWCYGLLWQNTLPPGYTGNPGTGGTIMSYADWRIPYFSNPNITIRLTGNLLGWGVNPDLGPKQIGVSETSLGSAYNAKVLTDQAVTMSNLSEEIVVPTITSQPQNVSVVRGQSFSFTVTAKGGGLSYQWLKNNVPITGAQESTYSKASEASEPDNYSVTVSNFAGTVTSNTATVTVTAPVSNSSSGGGGGGGGFLGQTVCGALCVLSFIRWARRDFSPSGSSHLLGRR